VNRLMVNVADFNALHFDPTRSGRLKTAKAKRFWTFLDRA
jgi:hypothetical protein